MNKFRKIISGFISVSMMLTSMSAVAFAEGTEDSATPLYTTHIWETFENEYTGELDNYQIPFEKVYRNGNGAWDYANSNYGNGVKIFKNTEKAAETVYPQLDIVLKNPLTVADAIANNLTVEVEFDMYGNELGTDDNYIWLVSVHKNPQSSDTKIQMKANGQTKIMNYGGAGTNQDIKGQNATEFAEFHTFKFVIHAKENAYSDVDGWVLDKFYYDGADQKNKAKYTEGLYIGAGDFTDLLFQIKSKANEGGEFGVDNVSVISYPTPSDGVSPVPDRKAYMDTLAGYKATVDAYNSSNLTAAYNEAKELVERDYILQSDYDAAINKIKALMPTVVTNHTFDTAQKTRASVENTSRYLFDDTKLSAYFANGGALSWDFDYDRSEDQWGKSTRVVLKDANSNANPINFTSMPANSYVEASFDIMYNISADSYLRIAFEDSANTRLARFNVQSDEIYASHKDYLKVPTSENELHRFKLVMQVTDENGDRVNKIKGLYLDGNKYANNNGVAWENDVDSFAKVEFFVNTANSDNKLPDSTTDLNQFWIDNFSVVTYTSSDGKSMLGEKSSLLAKIKKLSELYQNADETLKASIDAVIGDIVTVYTDASANATAVKTAEAEADVILSGKTSVELTGISFADADGNDAALSSAASVKSVSFEDECAMYDGAYILVASYVKNGTELVMDNVTYTRASEVVAGTNEAEISLALPSQTENRVVKAFIWSSLGTLLPLADSLEISE